MKTFEVVDISGDAGLRAYGQTLQELFVNAAMGMYSLITDPEAIREERDITVDIESLSLEGLLVAWLNELIFHFDAYGFIGRRIVITEITPTLALPRQGGGNNVRHSPLRERDNPPSSPLKLRGAKRGVTLRGGEGELSFLSAGERELGAGEDFRLNAVVTGEDFDPERHERRLLIKAATYHQLSIEKKEGQWVTEVIFDI